MARDLNGLIGSLTAGLAALILAGCGQGGEDKQTGEDQVTNETDMTAEQAAAPEDPFLWLEEVEGERALDWARARNAESLARLTEDPRYDPVRDAAAAIYTAQDRIPYGQLQGEAVVNFWQDKDHVRGIWRRAGLDSYKTDSPDWETLIDIDALAEDEGENWVWKGANCLSPDHERCIVNLSRGGADATVIREFDMASRSFVADGFALSEAKQSLAWIDRDTLLAASPLEGGDRNTSGYARTIRIWKRGTPLADAPTVFEGAEDDAFAFPAVSKRPEGTDVFIIRLPDFFHQTVYALGADNSLTELPLPDDVDFQGVFKGRAIVLLRSDWALEDGQTLPQGGVVALSLDALKAGRVEDATVIAAPGERRSIQGVEIGRDGLYVSVLDTVRGRLQRAMPDEDGGWTLADMDLPATGTIAITSADPFTDRAFINFERFLEPDTLYLVDGGAGGEATPVKAMPARFDSDPYTVEQRFTASADGTEIPYFLIHAKDMPEDGATPTILYGYGGFEIALTPGYLSPLAIEWLQRGGAYVVANIRGGGEFGPRWHRAALKENRIRAYEDFAAVAKDLIDSGVTSRDRLGIYGGSNGGLLTGATMVRDPELFGAVVSAVPLLDMLRYHKLLAGASWIGEYGNPDIPEERAFIAEYSPYQTVSAAADYPPIFLTTSTRDDRVHPGHARKMAAKMTAQGHQVLYYENIEGGHAGAANLNQRAMRDALVATFFLQELKDG